MDKEAKLTSTSSGNDIPEEQAQARSIVSPATSSSPLETKVQIQNQPGVSKYPFVSALPIQLDVRIPIFNFRFKDLLQLQAGNILTTSWSLAEDLPVAGGATRLLWAEFAVADQQLTVRVTRVA